MMNREQALSFAKASADMAWDQRHSSEYTDSFTSVDSYRDNVRDTLNDERAAEFEAEAFALFDDVIAKHRAVS